jgi:hypothetical protein
VASSLFLPADLTKQYVQGFFIPVDLVDALEMRVSKSFSW